MSGASFWDSLLYGLSLVTSEDEKEDVVETTGEVVEGKAETEKLEEKKDD